VLETVKIRPAGLVQGYTLAVDNSFSRKFSEGICDLRESFVDVLAVPGVKDCFAAFDPDGTYFGRPFG